MQASAYTTFRVLAPWVYSVKPAAASNLLTMLDVSGSPPKGLANKVCFSGGMGMQC